jgi:chaperonin GroES
MATATKSKTKIKLQPLGDRVVVQREDAETTTSGGLCCPIRRKTNLLGARS